MTSKLVVTALALSLLGVLWAAVPASAGDVATYDTQVKLRKSFPTFHGRVLSDTKACVKHREVRVYKRKRNGHKKLLGSDLASGHGSWLVTYSAGSGVYFAVAPKVVLTSTPVPTICLRDKSQTVVID